jgi:hypothetical protein
MYIHQGICDFFFFDSLMSVLAGFETTGGNLESLAVRPMSYWRGIGQLVNLETGVVLMDIP